jgi:hypothetical protein
VNAAVAGYPGANILHERCGLTPFETASELTPFDSQEAALASGRPKVTQLGPAYDVWPFSFQYFQQIPYAGVQYGVVIANIENVLAARMRKGRIKIPRN